MSTRSEQRRLRQLEIEKEQRLEDDEALKMTEEQRETLLHSFRSVKFEFHDLDGLSWTDSIRRELLQPEHTTPILVPQPSCVVLSKSDLASFSPEETIRASTGARLRDSTRLDDLEHSPYPTDTSDNFVTPMLRRGKRDGTRSRSPIKGLFPASTAPSTTTTSFPSDPHDSPHHQRDHYYGPSDDNDYDVPTPTATPPPIQTPTDDYDQRTIKMRDSPLSNSKYFSHKDPPLSPSPSYPELPSALISVSAPSCAEAGIITSIFRSPVFSPNNGRMRSSQACAVLASPKASPSLASVCTFSSP